MKFKEEGKYIYFSKSFGKTLKAIVQKSWDDIKYQSKPTDKDNKFYINEICKILEVTEYDLNPYLDEVIRVCELDSILEALEGCKSIVGLPRKDTKNPNRDKERFEKVQNEYKDLCSLYGLYYKHQSFDDRVYKFYEDELRKRKIMLSENLQMYCKTGINRSEKIAKILEEI